MIVMIGVDVKSGYVPKLHDEITTLFNRPVWNPPEWGQVRGQLLFNPDF